LRDLQRYLPPKPADGEAAVPRIWHHAVALGCAMAGPNGDALTDINLTELGGRYRTARQKLAELIAKTPPIDPSMRLFADLDERFARAIRLSDGQTVSLLPTPDGKGWLSESGEWKLIGGELHAATDRVGIRGVSAVPLGGGLEISTELDFPGPSCEYLGGINVVLIVPGEKTSVGIHLWPIGGECKAYINDRVFGSFSIPEDSTFKLSFTTQRDKITIRVGEKEESFPVDREAMSAIMRRSELMVEQSNFGTRRMHVAIKALTARRVAAQ
jgi:hypothetical protein